MSKQDFEILVNKYYNKIYTDRPKYIDAPTTFDRKVVYTAIEKINKNIGCNIECRRKKTWGTKCESCCGDPSCPMPIELYNYKSITGIQLFYEPTPYKMKQLNSIE